MCISEGNQRSDSHGIDRLLRDLRGSTVFSDEDKPSQSELLGATLTCLTSKLLERSTDREMIVSRKFTSVGSSDLV
jgi:hypothetical protein